MKRSIWPNRDPLATGHIEPEATSRFEDITLPFEFFNGGNLYHFLKNSPSGHVDPFGLDVWVIRATSGWGHEWIIGQNPDGSFWDSSKWPGDGPFSPANCPADIDFNEKSNFDPTSPSKYVRVMLRVRTSPTIDAEIKRRAKEASERDEGRYDALCNNCRHYARSLSRQAGWMASRSGISN